MDAYAALISTLRDAIKAAQDAGLESEHIAAALTKMAELVEAEA